jgi:hypothetical protein
MTVRCLVTCGIYMSHPISAEFQLSMLSNSDVNDRPNCQPYVSACAGLLQNTASLNIRGGVPDSANCVQKKCAGYLCADDRSCVVECFRSIRLHTLPAMVPAEERMCAGAKKEYYAVNKMTRERQAELSLWQETRRVLANSACCISYPYALSGRCGRVKWLGGSIYYDLFTDLRQLVFYQMLKTVGEITNGEQQPYFQLLQAVESQYGEEPWLQNALPSSRA